MGTKHAARFALPGNGRLLLLHPRAVLRDDHDAAGGTYRVVNLPLGLRSLRLSRPEFEFLRWLGKARDAKSVLAAHRVLKAQDDSATELDQWLSLGVLSEAPDGLHSEPHRMAWLEAPKPDVPEGVHPTRTPLVLYLELTQNCNLRCRHCFATEAASHERMPLATVLDVLHEANELGVLHLTLSGGEPTLHPNFAQILERAAQSRMAVTLLTNGTLFRKHPEWIELLAHLGRHVNQALNVSVSIDGSDEATHDGIRGRRGSFHHARTFVEELARQGFGHIAIGMVMFEENFRQLPEIVRWAADLGIGSVNPSVVRSLGRARETDTFRLDVATQWQALRLCSELQERYAGQIVVETPTPAIALEAASLSTNLCVPAQTVCSAGMRELAIRADGAIHPCPYVWSEAFTLGRFPETTLLQAWHDRRLQFFRGGYKLSDLEHCAGCADATRCLARICRASSIAKGNPTGLTDSCLRVPGSKRARGAQGHVSAP